MEKKEKLELRRQMFHLLLGIAIVVLYQINLLTIKILFVIFLIGLLSSFISLKYKIPIINWFLKNFERETEFKKNPGKGTLLYVAGVLIVLLLFEKNIALAAILILAVGDSVSHVVGKHFGKCRLKNSKHLEGTAAGIFFASIAASMFIEPKLAFLGSTAAMFFEVIELKIGQMMIDDNLTIPLIAGLTIYLVQIL